MDPLGTAMACLELIERIKGHIDQAKANKSQCQRLGERLAAIRDTIQAIAPQEPNLAGYAKKSYDGALDRLQATLSDADLLVQSFSKKQWYRRVVRVGNYQGRFEEIYSRLREDLQLLNVGLNVQQVSQVHATAMQVMNDTAKDAEAAKLDMDAIKGMMTELLEKNRQDIVSQINPKLDNLSNIVGMKMESLEYQMQAMMQMMQGMQGNALTQSEQVVARRGLVASVAQQSKEHHIDPLLLTPLFAVEFHDELTRGTFGRIYRGRWHRSTVAIKQPLDLNPEDITEFTRETKLHGRLRHENIVQFYAACMEPGRCVILMELMEGGSLLHWIEKNGPPSPFQVKQIASGVARALHYMHSASFVHRDINSKNVLLTADGLTAKLTDFGKTKDGNAGTDVITLSKDGPNVDTLRWQAPETINKGGIESASGRNDIYAFGLVLYHMITGKRPYEGLSNQQILQRLAQKQVDELPVNVPDILKNIYKACTNPQSTSRPSAGEVLDMLAQWNPPNPSSASSSSTPSPSSTPNGVSKDIAEGLYVAALQYEQQGQNEFAGKWYRLASSCQDAPQVSMRCKANLGMLIARGLIAGEPKQRGIELVKEAAEMGHNRSQYNLGELYAQQGDLHESRLWLQSAANAGNVTAQQRLSSLQ